MKRIVVAITGASGSVYGIRLLEILRDVEGVETHLIISSAGGLAISTENGPSVSHIKELADVAHSNKNIGAPLSSGSFRVDAMIIAPCSVRTASNIATGVTDELISRAADVLLKERRQLVVAIRETPLHLGHLETLVKLASLGAVIFPPVPSFYSLPNSIDDIVNQTCMRMLDQVGIEVDVAPRWGEANGVPAIRDDE